MNENEVKVFTLREANELLPILAELLHDLRKKRDQAGEIEIQIDALELVSNSGEDASARELEKLMERHRQVVAEFYDIVDEIQSNGCFLKDVDLGLIDFYGVVKGRIVCLCWRIGEERIGFWHDVKEGYAGREPLTSDENCQ